MLDFFNLKYESFGLEITDSFVRVAQFKKRGSGFLKLAAGLAPVARGVIKDGEIKDQKSLALAIKRALAATKNEKEISAKHVVASLPENKTFLEVIQMPRLSDGDLRSSVVFEAENYIPLPIEKVCLDSEIIENQKTPADHLDILLLAVPKAVVDSYADAIKAAGLKPLAFEPESQAVIRSVLANKPISGSIMIMHIGDSRANLIIYAANSPRFTFSIPVSNRYFLDTIAKFMKVSLESAENLKITYGISTQDFKQPAGSTDKKDNGQGKKIFEVLVPGLVDFMQQAGRCLEYYRNHASHEHGLGGEGRIGKIILCGSGANLKGLDDFISLKLNMPVVIAQQNFTAKKIISKGSAARAGDKYYGDLTVVAGLALRAATEGRRIAKI